MMISRWVGQRVIGPRRNGIGTITALGRLRGEQVAYVLWDEPQVGENTKWYDTVRACDLLPLHIPGAGSGRA